MGNIKLIQHHPGAPLFRLLGLGPKMNPVKAIEKLQNLLNNNTFWAKGRTKQKLKRMIANSCAIVTIWEKNQLIGFGRATSDSTYRAVLWDIVIINSHQKLGLGKTLLSALLNSRSLSIKNNKSNAKLNIKLILLKNNCLFLLL